MFKPTQNMKIKCFWIISNFGDGLDSFYFPNLVYHLKIKMLGLKAIVEYFRASSKGSPYILMAA